MDYYTQETLSCQANPTKKKLDVFVWETDELQSTVVIYAPTDPLEYLTITV